MPIPATGIEFGGINDTGNGKYQVNMTGTADASATIQAVLNDTAVCPQRVTLPPSGTGAGGLSAYGQRLTVASGAKLRFDSVLELPVDVSVVLDLGQAWIVNNTGAAHPIKIKGGGYLTPTVCRRWILGGNIEGGIAIESGCKPGLRLAHGSIYGASDYGLRFGDQCYWTEVYDYDFRQCAGAIYGPGVNSDNCYFDKVRVAWGGANPDVVLRSSGTLFEHFTMGVKLVAHLDKPHIEILPDDAGSPAPSQRYVDIQGGTFGGEVTLDGGGNVLAGPPETLITIGKSSDVTNVVRSLISIRDVTAQTAANGPGPGLWPLLGMSGAGMSKHFLTVNRPVQHCRVQDCALGVDYFPGTGRSFTAAPIHDAAAAAGYLANSRGNRYGGLLRSRLDQAPLDFGPSWRCLDGEAVPGPSPYVQAENLLADSLRLDSSSWTRSNVSVARLDAGGRWRVTTTNVLAELSQIVTAAEDGSYVFRVAARAGSLGLVSLFAQDLSAGSAVLCAADDMQRLDADEWREVWCRVTGTAGHNLKFVVRFGQQAYDNTGTVDLYWPTLERGERPSATRLRT